MQCWDLVQQDSSSPPVPLCPGVLTKGGQGFKGACASFVPLSPPLNHVLNSVKTSQWPGEDICVYLQVDVWTGWYTVTTLTNPLVEPLCAVLETAVFKGIILLSPLFSFVSLPQN